jgi:hypothetical protein
MKEFEFDSMEEFDGLFDSTDAKSVEEVSMTIFQGIKNAMDNGESEAELFSISFRNADDGLEVTLPKDQWGIALENCQKKFHQLELFDQAIDVYNLRKEIW